ncbi:MAG: helix-turn-helix transcriptional regulator [Proteobacteria bacterium]|nr:helix-turn-helix transcriptional regulator [Pseudomonadota bacterium]
MLSQRELSGRIGLPQAQISRIENGTVDPRLSSLIEIARALDLELVFVPRAIVPAVEALKRGRSGTTAAIPAYKLDSEDDDG